MGKVKTYQADYDRKGFWNLIATQFQGAFNDNLYQYVIMLMLVARGSQASASGTLTGWAAFAMSETFVLSFAVVVFSLPFIIFPSLFGALADRYSKQRVALATKYLEIVVMALGGVAFYLGNPVFIWTVLFLMATQSAMFSPAKYGIIPEIMPEPRLSWANGILQMGTIIAIIAGTGLAGPVYDRLEDRVYLASALLVGLSALGIVTAYFITKPPAANPRMHIPKNPLLPWSGMGPYFKAIWKDKVLFNVVLGYIYFWFGGVLVRQSVLSFGNSTLHLSETYVTPLVAAMAIGIGVGAVAAGYLSRNQIEMGIVPIGAGGMGVFALALSILGVTNGQFMPPMAEGQTEFASLAGFEGYYAVCVFCLLMLGAFAGFFDVPLAAAIQARAPYDMKGGVIATTNMLTFVGMLIAGLMFGALGALQLSSYHIFMISALMSVGMCGYLIYRLPHLLLRSGMWILTNTVYRIRILGRENVPEIGAAVFVANPSRLWMCCSSMPPPTVTCISWWGEDVHGMPRFGRLARLMNLIPVPKNATEAEMAAVVEQIRGLLREGHTVCVPQEQRFSREGAEAPWHGNYGMLTEGTEAPIVPVYIARLWGTLYNFDTAGKFHLMRPPRLPYSIMVNYGAPCTHTAGPAMRDTLQRLGTDAYIARPLIHSMLHRGLIKVARRNKRKLAIADGITGELSFFKTLVGTIAFARKLQKTLDRSKYVGLLLPPSVGGALTNTALQLMGRVPVNLNYSASNEAIASAARQCEITQVLTSKKVLERLPIEVPGEAIFLEDVRETVTSKDRIVALLFALLAPVWLIERACGSPWGRTTEDVATIIFSSGSEGAPKGVVLTQRNILANVESALETFPHASDERMMAFLPFFHSFGFTGTLWLMLMSGCGTVYHPTPLEPRVIGKLIQKYTCTVLIGTPTFLNGFLRRCEAEQLASLRFVVCGAEKMPATLRDGFLEKFGTALMEGYGTTECAPVVSVSIPDMVSPGFYVPGNRIGSIGRPLPGISLRVTNPDTGEEVTHGTPGMLHVKGVNIMREYLDQPDKTAAVLRDGWYETGDVAAIDDDGFIRITDRLARFSKVAGEMVPHTTVEERLLGLVDGDDQNLAVSSVPDEKRGERLVVLHTLSDDALERLIARMPETGLPNLWLPRSNNFHRVDEIPVLGTGKLDIRGVREVAKEREGAQ